MNYDNLNNNNNYNNVNDSNINSVNSNNNYSFVDNTNNNNVNYDNNYNSNYNVDNNYSNNNDYNVNNNYNNSYNNTSYYNDSSTPNDSDHKPNTTKRKILRFISRIILLIVLVFIVMMILSSLKIIKLPWLDYPEVLNLSQSEIVLKQKGNFQLSSAVYPSQVPYGRILYESSDPDVVTVNQITGFIVAKKNGVATITAKLEEYGDILDTCDVVVSDTVVYISKIKSYS